MTRDVGESLKVISQLKVGQKLSTRSGKLIAIGSGHFDHIRRWIKGEDRLTMMIHIMNVVNDALIMGGFTQELLDAVPGMLVLKETYASDTSMACDIDHTIKKMKGEPIHYGLK